MRRLNFIRLIPSLVGSNDLERADTGEVVSGPPLGRVPRKVYLKPREEMSAPGLKKIKAAASREIIGGARKGGYDIGFALCFPMAHGLGLEPGGSLVEATVEYYAVSRIRA